MSGKSNGRHPRSVSATDLSKLGQCELMVALNLPDAATREMKELGRQGEAEHDRFHLRAVLNAGSAEEIARLRK
jgi:hypothetical protein